MTNTNTPETTPSSFLSNNAYDILKKFAQLWLPAAGTLYFALSGIWGFPHGEKVIGTIAAVNVFLGVILGVSTKSYDASVSTEETAK